MRGRGGRGESRKVLDLYLATFSAASPNSLLFRAANCTTSDLSSIQNINTRQGEKRRRREQ